MRYDADTGVFTLRASRDDFRILQLADTHICGSVTTARYDRMAFRACYELIRRAEPDLIIVTGDLVYPIPAQTFSANNLNNLGVRYRGVDLVYSKSIDYTAYPGIAHRSSQRDATLVTLDSESGYAIEVLDYPESR